MANTNITRAGTNAQKKVKRVLSIRVNEVSFQNAGVQLAVGTQHFLVAQLPERSVLTDAYVVVDSVANSATTATAALGTAEAGAQIMAAADVKTAAVVTGSLVGKLKTGTGMPIYLALVYTGATTNFGDYTVVIEYTEYTKKSGEYTQFI